MKEHEIHHQGSEMNRTVLNSDLHYEHFAQSEPSLQVNQESVHELFAYIQNDRNALHLDVATGTGLIPTLLRREGFIGDIVGVDPNKDSLAIARQKEREQSQGIIYIEGYGQNVTHDLRYLKKATSASMNDAIHEVGSRKEQQAVFNAISDKSEQGAYFLFNSAFTTMSSLEGMRDLGRWRLAINKLTGLPREKNREANGRVTGVTENSPEIYSELLTNAGYKEIHSVTRRVIFDRPAIEAITMYPRFTQSFYDDLIGQESIPMTDKVAMALKALDIANITEVPRVWYESISQKVSDPIVN